LYKKEDLIPIEIKGTTPSGLGFRTTIGNTLNKIFYMGYTYYLISNRLIDEYIIIRCAGDDGTSWGEEFLMK